MLLAGGQGSRLYALTKDVAKPSVPFGGKYRIIDFPLSNCANSGIDVVGVLTQYKHLQLNSYIGSGQAYDLDSSDGGVFILPPYQSAGEVGSWFSGTANAIYQNMAFIENYDPENVLILSGDHIYKMDYSDMLREHVQNNADCTIAVLEVPRDEASRFGIMTADETGRILEFEEKPREPKSTLASMGVYIFTWEKLRKQLVEDEAERLSSHDFGKDIIPSMLAEGAGLYAYRFDGYWKDAGTIDSLWEANMDLLNPNVPLALYDPGWKIYARNPALPPHHLGPNAVVSDSMVSEGCEIDGEVDFSVLFAGVTVEAGASVHGSVLMPNAVVRAGAVVEYSIVAEGAAIGESCRIGERPEDSQNRDAWGITVISSGVTVAGGTAVPAGAMVSADLPANAGQDAAEDGI